MKTSNKILLTVFLAAIGILAGIYLSLYAEYKSGHYTAMKDLLKDQYIRHELAPVRQVVVTGMDNLTIIPSDTAHLDIQKEHASRIRFRLSGDTLLINGDTTLKSRDGSTITTRSYTNVNLYLPSLDLLRAKNSSFFLSGVTDKSRALSSQIELADGANLELSRNPWQDSSARYFGRITIRSGPSSNVVLSANAVVESLDLSLDHSGFQDEEAGIGTLAIQSDSSSSFEIHGKNLSRVHLVNSK